MQEKAIKLESKSNIFRQKRKIYYFNLPNHNFRKVQCDFASFRAGNLGTHLKIHSGEKSNKCNQCNYVSSQTSNLRTHLKTHGGENSNKCSQCDYASSQVGHFRTHLITHSGEKLNKCNHTTPQKGAK